MGKYIYLVILATILFSFKQDDGNVRTKNFPKEEQKTRRLPPKKNVWIFILAGQSNMAGRGLVWPQDTIPSERIFSINKNGEIILAKEPLHFYEPQLTGLDCGLSFGKELLKHIPDEISILLLPTAVGGSAISQWLGDSLFRNVQLYSNFTEKVKIGKKHGHIKGILWLQGENDATTDANIALYKDRLSELLVKFRKTTRLKKLPVIIGELGEDDEQVEKVNEQIKSYVPTDRNCSLINTSGLKMKEDKVHFNSESLRILGQRYATEYLTNYYQTNGK